MDSPTNNVVNVTWFSLEILEMQGSSKVMILCEKMYHVADADLLYPP
jgi:hypothetical protein